MRNISSRGSKALCSVQLILPTDCVRCEVWGVSGVPSYCPPHHQELKHCTKSCHFVVITCLLNRPFISGKWGKGFYPLEKFISRSLMGFTILQSSLNQIKEWQNLSFIGWYFKSKVGKFDNINVFWHKKVHSIFSSDSGQKVSGCYCQTITKLFLFQVSFVYITVEWRNNFPDCYVLHSIIFQSCHCLRYWARVLLYSPAR